jgi:hypothetical protein
MMASVGELLGVKNINLLSGFSEKIILQEKLID